MEEKLKEEDDLPLYDMILLKIVECPEYRAEHVGD